MDASQFIRIMYADLVRGVRSEVEALTQEEMYFRPTEDANSIAFVLWHSTRGQDTNAHRLVKGTPSLWESEGWHQRFGLSPQDGGTGFSGEQVGAFRPDKDELLAYCRRVWEEVPAILEGLTDADLDRVPNPDRPTMTVGRSLANFALGHGFWHLGDVRFLKGLQGQPFGR